MPYEKKLEGVKSDDVARHSIVARSMFKIFHKVNFVQVVRQ